jgi:hypothetical protein
MKGGCGNTRGPNRAFSPVVPARDPSELGLFRFSRQFLEEVFSETERPGQAVKTLASSQDSGYSLRADVQYRNDTKRTDTDALRS